MNLYAGVDPDFGNNANTGGINDFDTLFNFQFSFNAILLTASGLLRAQNDGIAFEGIECFDITIDNGGSTCFDSYGSIPSTSICVIDRTRMYCLITNDIMITLASSVVWQYPKMKTVFSQICEKKPSHFCQKSDYLSFRVRICSPSLDQKYQQSAIKKGGKRVQS